MGKDMSQSFTDIQKDEWSEFFESFTHTHQGWLVRITNMGDDAEIQEWENGLPLEGLTHHLDHDISCVSIIVRQDAVPHGHLLHTVKGVTQITAEESVDDEHFKLHVTARNEIVTTIVFHRATIPDHQADPAVPNPSL